MLTWKLSCPHCGGPNKVAAARHCLACEFCGAGLWVQLPLGYPTLVAAARVKRREAVFAWDRHLKTHDQPLSQSQRRVILAYLPFWRVSGLVAMREEIRYVLPVHEVDTGDGFGSADTHGPGYREERRPGEWSVRPREITIPAFPDSGGGLDSLGVRVETVPLGGWHEAKAPEDAWRVAPTVGRDEALRRFDAATCATMEFEKGRESPEHFLITPQLALVYWPVWQLGDDRDDTARGVEIDAVNGRIIRETDGIAQPSDCPAGVEGEIPELLPHRCPECGCDLPVDPRQVVFLCGNCRALTAHTSCGARTTVRAECAEGHELTKDTWYPFWCFEGASQVLVPA
ncbi:MAG TPA: hypothetical protein VM118_08280, partial [Acidobacteriota bacterium]|nr:hypothetical protein [Acidobacteriota bacterium]